MTLEIDFETQSDVDLGKRGVYNYMASPLTKPLFGCYQLNGGEIKRWDAHQPCPPEIIAHVEAGGTVKAHNAGFERLLWQRVLTPRYGWPEIRNEQFVCTAATAAAMALPRKLEKLGVALNLKLQKDTDGLRLIRKFSIPRKPRKGEDPNGIYFNAPEEHPEDWAKFHAYCARDVEAEAEADKRMVPLSDADQACYQRSERINDRGIRIDTQSVAAALTLIERAKVDLDKQMTLATSGYVTSCSQVARLTAWIQEQGVEIDSVGKAELEDLLELEDLPAHVRHVIEIRQEAGKSSVSKLPTFLKRVSADSRLRGAFLFRAAGTGRYSSTGAQVHNLPRYRRIYEDAALDQNVLFKAFRTGSPAYLKTLYGEELGRPLHLLSDAMRGFLWADPGHDILAADYSGIEGAVAAWLADERWKVEAMFEIIADPDLPDLYRRSAAGIFNTTVDEITKKDPRRQVGKVSELSLQYQGGVGAFRSMARNYAMKIDPIYDPVWGSASQERRDTAEERYERCLSRNDPTTQVLSRRAWIAADLVKAGWRSAHPRIVESWGLLEDAVFDAVSAPGQIISVLKLKYVVRHDFLWCMLPSGRCLAYGAPRIKDQVWTVVQTEEGTWPDAGVVMDRDHAEELERQGKARVQGAAKSKVSVLGVNSQSQKLERYGLYGGLIFENVVQAIALDLLENGLEHAEAYAYEEAQRAGIEIAYPLIGHVHDEILTEVPRGLCDVAEFERRICQLPAWAAGLPLTASGWRGKRYRK